MSRAFNFSAGPANLPTAVLAQAQSELLDWGGTGVSVMEMSHRSDAYTSIAHAAEQDLRDLLNIPDNYKVIFTQGGASLQFSAIPLNLLGKNRRADYLNTGIWSTKAIEEAQNYGNIHVAATGEESHFTTVPAIDTWECRDNAAYFHYTPNETINGVEIMDIPSIGDVPLVADMSSTLLSRPIDVSRFGLIYAGAQKNIGPAGLTIIIIRDDLLDQCQDNIPSLLRYDRLAKADSMLNTPATYSWYLSGLVFKWLKEQGGLEQMREVNERKAKALYTAIDSSDFYANNIDVAYRSWMNIPFTLADTSLEKAFLQAAKKVGLMTLAGHRSVGGMRASIYNAMPEEGVHALVDFMREFEKEHTA